MNVLAYNALPTRWLHLFFEVYRIDRQRFLALVWYRPVQWKQIPYLCNSVMPKSCYVLLIHKNVRYTHFSSLRWNFVSRPKKNKTTNNSNNNNKNKVSPFHCGMGKMFRMRVWLVWDELSSRQPNFWPWLSHPFFFIFIVLITIWTILRFTFNALYVFWLPALHCVGIL